MTISIGKYFLEDNPYIFLNYFHLIEKQTENELLAISLSKVSFEIRSTPIILEILDTTKIYQFGVAYLDSIVSNGSGLYVLSGLPWVSCARPKFI
ncbi:hypothetical protein SAMN05443144_12457 [Fodinibius roseus]|uniref:Uncharacterized protein n=1 Tax=Fodinibius roseus TaxID=1194090 RepID=A0A1M5IUD0_9BACT|nr:hypothetical protein SAMN05443144_12457 [Fodinibius roseus]